MEHTILLTIVIGAFICAYGNFGVEMYFNQLKSHYLLILKESLHKFTKSIAIASIMYFAMIIFFVSLAYFFVVEKTLVLLLMLFPVFIIFVMWFTSLKAVIVAFNTAKN